MYRVNIDIVAVFDDNDDDDDGDVVLTDNDDDIGDGDDGVIGDDSIVCFVVASPVRSVVDAD